ncbi:cold shock domain-containing protein [Parapedobacter sp. ISTM3]|uniref:cold-shock protein n=1 Tax=Parapedobacter sp. ISTM3 TaxID=2800130 RepID=UPI0019083075|nr:cold shock domain-containing protein [Parapedobacter sp. ISTM3]MBK1441418.1 cold shock domain-containing protein [Parapedobacter sp. ISTM3]
MFIGAVKWFDNKKGFGIIALPSGEELFLHIRGFVSPPQGEIKSSTVIFGHKKINAKRDGYTAAKCRILDHQEDWKAATLLLLGTNDMIQLPDRRKKEHKHSLMKLAVKQLLQGKNENFAFAMLTSNFDSSFDPSVFIPYAMFLEKTIPQVLEKTSAARLLVRIFQHFGTCITHEILFRVWKAGKFRYLGYDKQGDYEIPEEVLNLNATEIGYDELRRISAYSFGTTFCAEFVNALFDGIETMERSEIDALIPYLDFLENGDREYWKAIVDT